MRLHCHELSAATASSAPLVDGAWHLVRGQGPAAVLVPMAVLAGFAAALTRLAARFFSWETH